MNRATAELYRKKIERVAVSLPDDEAIITPEMFPRWKSQVIYNVGDRICYNRVLYKCVQGHTSQNDWKPDVTPALWTEINVDTWPEWKQPTGVQDAYMIDDKVSHNELRWISLVDNNVWEPVVYGWKQEN